MRTRGVVGCFREIGAAILILALGMISPGLAQTPPALAGCPVLPADNIWNTPIDTMPVDPNSSLYLATIGSTKGVHPDFGSGMWDGGPIGIPYNVVPGSQPKVTISFDYADESDPGPYPIPPDPAIEGGSQSTGDRHILVVDHDHCLLYETWSTYPQADGSWCAGSGAIFNLRSNALRPPTWTSSDAAGLPILPGLVRYDEVASGEINHAIRFTVPQTRKKFIWPARHYASSLTDQKYPPMGQRFRLKAGFDISGFDPEVQVILKALKKYGMILADNGSSWFISGVPDSRWDDDMLVSQLKLVAGSNFEAVDESSLMVDPNSGQARSGSFAFNPNPPDQPVRLIFIHHSTGQNWLADGNGRLGIALRDNNYFVSDTNYGWGPDSIGDNTDIGHWWLWFRGPDSFRYVNALYGEGDQHCDYTRMSGDPPAGQNEVILFKSCFPNSALQGNPGDPVPAIGDNSLRGEGSGSEYHTVANAKGIYIDLLEYFRTRQDKLFIAIAAPPLTDPTWSHNARAFNEWLVNTWLQDYPYKNVAVFDFYNVLTTNGGNANINDLNQESGNHHRWWNGSIQHKTDGDNDPNPDVLEYPSGDDHPSQAGNLKATGEFLSLLNVSYHRWKDALQPYLVANFPPEGLWQYRNAAWSQLTEVSPNHMAGYGNKLVANFLSYGLYQHDGASWSPLTSNSSVENIVGVSDKMCADFGSLGLWQYNGTWTQLTPANPDKMAANGNNLLATFPSAGLYQYDGTTWTQLTSADGVESMLAISGKVYVDFGDLGLWKYDGRWTNLSAADPDKIQAHNGKLVANFPGYGLYQHDGTMWTQLTANDTVQNLLGVAGNLYADYGSLGLYRYNGAWSQLSPADPNRLGSYGEKLVVNFPDYGLYEYDDSGWTPLTENAGVTDMVGVELP